MNNYTFVKRTVYKFSCIRNFIRIRVIARQTCVVIFRTEEDKQVIWFYVPSILFHTFRLETFKNVGRKRKISEENHMAIGKHNLPFAHV